MKTILLKYPSSQPTRPFYVLPPHSQESLVLGAIALVTTIATLGIVFCLFDQTECVRITSTGAVETLHGFKDCAPPHLR
jgi:hypothetical protein